MVGHTYRFKETCQAVAELDGTRIAVTIPVGSTVVIKSQPGIGVWKSNSRKGSDDVHTDLKRRCEPFPASRDIRSSISFTVALKRTAFETHV
jgi:hypothetical protein